MTFLTPVGPEISSHLFMLKNFSKAHLELCNILTFATFAKLPVSVGHGIHSNLKQLSWKPLLFSWVGYSRIVETAF